MIERLRRLGFVGVMVVSLVLGGHPAFADDDGGGANNIVQLHNNQDGAAKERGKTSITEDQGSTVDNSNIALAEASCTDCRTVAVAVQAVIVSGDVTVFTPGNAAVAVNDGCVRCATFAYARQELLQTDGPFVLSNDAREQAAAVSDQIRALAASDESFSALSADLDALTDQLVSILETDIANGGKHDTRNTDRRVDEHDD